MGTSTLGFIIFAVFYFILAKNELKLALILLLAGLPLYQIRFVVAGLPLTILEIMILIAFAVWLIFHTKLLDILRRRYGWQDIKENRKRRQAYPFAWEIICLLFISYGAAALSGFSEEALGIWKAYFYEPVLVFILVLNVFAYKNDQESALGGKQENGNDADGKNGPRPASDRARFILWPLLASAGIVSLIAILQKFGLINSPVNFWPRVTGPFPYPNALGLYLGPLIMVLFGWLIGKLRITNYELRITTQDSKFEIRHSKFFAVVERMFVLITIILSVSAIYLARSEGALIGVAAGLAVFGGLWFFSCSRYGQFLPIVAASTIMILIIYSPFIFMKLSEYKYLNSGVPIIDKAADKIMLNDLSGEIRKKQWRETWEMLKDNKRWFWGTGLAGYQKAIGPYHQEGIFFNKDRDTDFRRKIVNFDEKYKAERWQPVEIYLYPHSIFLNFWTELGLPGAMLFIWMIAKFFFIGISRFKRGCEIENGQMGYKYLNFGLLSAMTVILVHGIVDVPYFKNDLAVMFWVLLALMSIVNLEFKAREKEKSVTNTD